MIKLVGNDDLLNTHSCCMPDATKDRSMIEKCNPMPYIPEEPHVGQEKEACACFQCVHIGDAARPGTSPTLLPSHPKYAARNPLCCACGASHVGGRRQNRHCRNRWLVTPLSNTVCSHSDSKFSKNRFPEGSKLPSLRKSLKLARATVSEVDGRAV